MSSRQKGLFVILFFMSFVIHIVADISFIPANPVPEQTVKMTAAGFSYNSRIIISWNFGDGNTISTSNRTVQHSYRNPGNFTVIIRSKPRLSIVGSTNVITDTKNISIAERRSIQFNPAKPGPGQNVSFKAVNFFSDRLLWIFGDGSRKKTGNQVAHSYNNPGTYNIIVKENSGDSRTLISKRIIIAENRSISFSPSNPLPGQEVILRAQNFSSNCVHWNFGDGSNKKGKQTESHRFNKAGTFRIEAKDFCGDYKPISVNIRVVENRDISYLPSMPQSGQEVVFSTQRFISNCIIWNFGDGSNDIRGKRKEHHVFNRSGSFQITARDNCGKGISIKKTVRITMNNRRLSYQPSHPKSGQNIVFSARSFNSNCLLWNFGDGTGNIRGKVTQSHLFKHPGTYRVSVIDECGKSKYGKVESIVNVSLAPKLIVPLSITGINLKFEDGEKSKKVLKDLLNLKAIADLRFKGSGLLKLQWLLNSKIIKQETLKLKTSNQMMIVANKIKSPSLSTLSIGKHRVTLRFISPSQTIFIPYIEYTVIDKSPFVNSAFPMSVNPGQEYLLKLNGGNFNIQTVFNPGAGIKVLRKAVIKNSREAELQISVSSEISEGIRLIKAGNNTGTNTGPGKLIIKKLTEARSGDAVIDCPITNMLEKMKIEKLRPDSYSQTTGEHMDNSNPHVLTNESVLSWTLIGESMEINYYTIEFYSDKEKNHLLASRKVPGYQTFLKSDFKLIGDLRKARFPLIDPEKISPCDPAYINKFKADVYWTVNGYQIIDCPGAKAETWPKEVLRTECDEFELLNLPKSWTGIDCPDNGKGGKINIVNLDRDKTAGSYSIITGKVINEGSIDPNNYPLQRWELSGSIDTGYTPIGVSGNIIWKPQSEMGVSIVESVEFDNVFIDWGDGNVERLKGTPGCIMSGNINASGRDGRNVLKGKFNLQKVYHNYAKTGTYIIRICQLPNGFLPDKPADTGTDPEQVIINQIAQLSKNNFNKIQLSNSKDNIFMTSNSSVQELTNALDYGVLFYCQEVSITNRIDLCASGPLNLKSVKITGFPAKPKSNKLKQINNRKLIKKKNLSIKKKKLQIQVQQLPTACTYDHFIATADIKYFGTGSIEVRWLVDGFEIGKETYHGLSSSQRQNIENKNTQSDCSNAINEILIIDSPKLPVSNIGKRKLQVVVRVIASPSNADSNFFISSQILNHSNPASVIPWVKLYLDNLPDGINEKTYPNLRVSDGVTLSELKVFQKKYMKNTVTGQIVQYPPVQVVDLAEYLVKDVNSGGSIPGESYPGVSSSGDFPWLVFPTEKGDFKIANVYGRLKKTGKSYSGEGAIILPFTSGQDSNKEYIIPIVIKNWIIDESNGLVKNGTINLAPQKSMQQTPAVSAFLKKLKCRVFNGKKEDMKASLEMELKNKELRFSGDDDGTEKLPKWDKTASLTADGDWISSAPLKEILLSWTGSRLSSPAITFDFHKKKHTPASGKCSNDNPSWVGVDLGEITIKPYTFDIIGDHALTIKTNGWVINDQGVCGHAESIAYSMKFKKGNIAFNKLIFDASYGQFKAVYKNMKIYVPWLDSELKGDALLNKLSGQYGLDFSNVTSPIITKNYGQFTLKASNLRFTTEKNIGWVIRSNTHFDLRSEDKTITEFTVPEFFYGFDGYPYFSEGDKTYSIDIGQSSKLGDTSMMLKQAHLTGHGSGNKALNISIPAEIFISENPIIPAADTQLDYTVITGNPVYSGQGPFIKSFSLDVQFPLGSPSINAKMTPEYKPDNGTRYYGQVDMGMFGGPPVKAQLLLGYKGGKSYFLIRGDIPLGPNGIPMSPLPFSLYKLIGGLGYNFPVNSFYNMSIENAQPDMSGKTLFMAGMRIGSSDKFTFMMDGITTVKTSGEAGMKFDAWLLTRNHNNSGQIQGVLQYGNGAFSGQIWGNLSLMNNMVGIDLGTNENNAAMDIYLGNGDWHLYAGDRDGQRIEAFILGKKTAEGYLMLGNQIGLAAGGRQNWNLGGGNAAYVRGIMDVGLQITPQPKIKGDFNAGLSAGVCVPDVGCISGGVNARIRLSALPLEMRTTVNLDLPWPLGSITFTVNL